MDNTLQADPRGRASKPTSISFFPQHNAVIRAFASQDNRTYSNAAQTIVEQWAREHGFAHLLPADEPSVQEAAA
jgi:hypothetical protein